MGTEPGVKLDDGKIRLSTLVLGYFPRALMALGFVSEFGAEKYTIDGWSSVPGAHTRYSDAMVRHQLAELAGEFTDADSGLAHDAHLAWNALARLELRLREEENNVVPD